MKTVTEAQRVPPSLDTGAVSIWLIGITLLLLPITVGWHAWAAPGAAHDFNQRVFVPPFDLALAVLVVVHAADALERRIRSTAPQPAWPPLSRLLAVTAGWFVVAAVVHPSWRGLDLGFHVLGAWAVIRTAMIASPRQRSVLLWLVSAIGVLQGCLGIVQSLTGAPIGLGILEVGGRLYEFGDSAAGTGSFVHPYHLATLLLASLACSAVLARRASPPARRLALAAVAVLGIALPLTFSRAAMLALVPMTLLWARARSTRAIAVALAVGLLIGLSLGFSGVVAKSSKTMDAERIDSARRERAAEALRLMEEEPIFGVGPGRYVIALRDVEHEDLLPPHNLVLHAGAEAGLPGLALAACTVVAFGLWLFRRTAHVVAVGLALVPLHLLDSFPHAWGPGILITGLWLAAVTVAASDEHRV